MIPNTIHARLQVSYQGETHTLETTLDLDQCPAKPGQTPDFHSLLAKAAGIDTYSYLYEALETEEIAFSAPTGLAMQAFADGAFDWPRFEQASRDERDWETVRAVALQLLGPRDKSWFHSRTHLASSPSRTAHEPR